MNYRKSFELQNIFVLFALVFGFFILLFTPPFYGFDESLHFWRAYQISEEHIVSERQNDLIGGTLPKSLLSSEQFVYQNFRHPDGKLSFLNYPSVNIPLDKDVRIFINFPNSALYSPIPYIPQAIGMFIGRVLNQSPLVLMYLGRFFNLAFWIVLVYFSIKTTPVFKNVFFLLALTPIILFQSASLSADAITNGLSILLISLFLKYAFRQDCFLSFKNVVLFILISSLIALSEQAYLILMLLFY